MASYSDDDSFLENVPRIKTVSQAISDDDSINSENTSVSKRPDEVDFADVIEKLTYAIDNVKTLKPWKDRALKAEQLTRELTLTISKLRDELNDAQYDLQKWKKRAVRSEKENQDEILKWKYKVQANRKSRTELRDDDDELFKELGGETVTHLLSESDDNSSISNHDNHSKSIVKLTGGKSFRAKWKNLKLDDEPSQPQKDVTDKYVTVESVTHSEQSEEKSGVEAEEILNNYLSMNGRFSSRRFDSKSSPKSSRRKVSKPTEKRRVLEV